MLVLVQVAQVLAALIEQHRAVTSPIRPATPARPGFAWPAGWQRLPDDDWARQPVDAFGEAYDSLDHHGWYTNLDPTVEELSHLLDDGDMLRIHDSSSTCTNVRAGSIRHP